MRMLTYLAAATLGLCALTAGCMTNTFGAGVGQPALPDVPVPTPVPTLFVQISPNSTPPFVQLVNTGHAAVDLSTLTLATHLATPGISLAAPFLIGSTPLQPGARAVIDVSTLPALQGAAGELALVNAQLEVMAYAAWGNAPEVWGSDIAQQALFSGAVNPNAYAAVPYPLPSTDAIAQDPNAPGVLCTLPNAQLDGPPVDSGNCGPNAPRGQVIITEIAVAGATGGALDANTSWIEVTNVSAAPVAVNLYGVRLCRPAGCTVIRQSIPLAAPGSGGIPDPARALLYLGIPAPAAAPAAAQNYYFPDVAPIILSGDELALYAPGGVDSTVGMWSYVRLGTPLQAPAVYLSDADAAGLWDGQDSVNVTPGAGQSLSQQPEDGVSAANWFAATATPLAPN